MSATEILEQFRKLTADEQRELFEQIRGEFDIELTPEQIAELDRRAEDALKHPERCRPLEDAVVDIEKRFRSRQ